MVVHCEFSKRSSREDRVCLGGLRIPEDAVVHRRRRILVSTANAQQESVIGITRSQLYHTSVASEKLQRARNEGNRQQSLHNSL